MRPSGSSATVRGRHKKQSGGHGQFGDVVIEFSPGETQELTFEEKVVGGAVPKNFFPAVEKGLKRVLRKGRSGRLSHGVREGDPAGRLLPSR